jgi:hypothetical protein
LLTTGSTSPPFVLAAESMTDAIAIPAMPVSAPPKATRASCPDPRTGDSALPSTLRTIPMKYKNAKPASSMRNALMRLFD